MVTPGNRAGYLVLVIGVVAGLFFGWENDNAIKDVNNKQTRFILNQCRRDDMRNDIVIDSLESAKRRTAITYKGDLFLRKLEVDRIQEQIDKFKDAPLCELP